MTKTLREIIGMDKKNGHLPPKYLPKLRIRLSDDRTKKMAEFDVELPLEGYYPRETSEIGEKMVRALEILGVYDVAPKVLAPEAEEPVSPTDSQPS